MSPALRIHGDHSRAPVLKTAGSQPILDEGQETGPPPATAERAETVFEVTGIALILAIVLSAVLILIRGRR